MHLRFTTVLILCALALSACGSVTQARAQAGVQNVRRPA